MVVQDEVLVAHDQLRTLAHGDGLLVVRREVAQRARRTRLRTAQMSAGYAVAELEAALVVPEDRSAAGFFDVDNTMMQGASIYYLARGLAARRYFTTADLLRFGARQLRFRLLAAEHGGDMSQARQAVLQKESEQV